LNTSQSQRLPLKGRKILLGICGSVSAYKAATLARLLVKSGASVWTCFSTSADHFIGPETLRGITGIVPYSDSYQSHQSLGAEPHITLADKADLFIVYPATANTIAKLAAGMADDPVSLTSLAFAGQKMLCPAMASEMWDSPKTVDNCKILEKDGYQFVGPEVGELASGRTGLGRLSEPEQVYETIKFYLGKKLGILAGRKLLVSAGGTREPIDPVRYIGNNSTGKMGHAIAEAARDMGAEVSLVTTASGFCSAAIDIIVVSTALQMKDAIDRLSPTTDALIMAAAVADFRPADQLENKFKKSSTGLAPAFELVENPDIVAQSNACFKVAFAAETENLEENARLKLERKSVDLVVANNVKEYQFGSDQNKVIIFDKNGDKTVLPESTKFDIACSLLSYIAEKLD